MPTSVTDVYRETYSYGSAGYVAEPVSLAEAKTHCRVDFTDDDPYFTALIPQCRRAIENYCHISIVSYTVTATIEFDLTSPAYYQPYGIALAPAPKYPSIELPYGPVQSVTSVTSIGDDNTITILSPTSFDYYIRGTKYPKIEIVNPSWNNAIIVYTAGYTTCPLDLKLAILNEIAFRYQFRGDDVNRYAQQNVGISEGAQALAKTYIRLAWL